MTCSRSLKYASALYASALNDLGVITKTLPVIVTSISLSSAIIDRYDPVVSSAPPSDTRVVKLLDEIRFISLLISQMFDSCTSSLSHWLRELMYPSRVVGWFSMVIGFMCQVSSHLKKSLRVRILVRIISSGCADGVLAGTLEKSLARNELLFSLLLERRSSSNSFQFVSFCCHID